MINLLVVLRFWIWIIDFFYRGAQEINWENKIWRVTAQNRFSLALQVKERIQSELHNRPVDGDGRGERDRGKRKCSPRHTSLFFPSRCIVADVRIHLCNFISVSFNQSSSPLYVLSLVQFERNLRQFSWPCVWPEQLWRKCCLSSPWPMNLERLSDKVLMGKSASTFLEYLSICFDDRCVFRSRNVTTNETVAIKKMSIMRTRDGLPASVIREAALLKRVGKVDSDNLIK